MPDAPKTLAEALVALQAQLPRIPKTDEAQVGTRTYRYANLATITDLLMPIMSKLGLAWSCLPTVNNDRFVLQYELTHGPSGNSLIGLYPLPATGTPQQIGSAITYARRYALTAVTGIAPADDDGGPVEDEWTGQPAGQFDATPEDQPGSSNGRQHQRLGVLYGQLGITERELRLTDMRDRTGREVSSAKDLSFVEAEQAIKELATLVHDRSAD